jgi:hypothetical protein
VISHTKVLMPDTRPTWTFDIGYWILDIPIVLTPDTRPTWTFDIGY